MNQPPTLRLLRIVGHLEGASYLLLLFVAMPLKYGFDLPLAVRVVGLAHGLLFLAFVFLLARTASERGWTWARSFHGLLAALIPFAMFPFEASLRREEATPVVKATDGTPRS